MIRSSYLSEEMYLHDLHSAHEELSNDIRSPCTLEGLKILYQPTCSPSPSKRIKKHLVFSVDTVLYLGIYDKYKHISSNNDISSQLIAVNFLW